MKHPVRRSSLVLWLVLSLLVAACVLPAAAAAQAEKPYGGTFVWGTNDNPDTLNTFGTVLSIVMTIEHLVYDTLVQYDQDFNFQPRLAKSWDTDDANLTYTFHLQENARWHDGQPVTAADVKFTIDMVKTFELGTFASYMAPVQDVQTPDEHTVVMKLAYPSATFFSGLRNFYIMPRHIWSQFKTKEDIIKFPNEPMVGSGPFKFAEYKKDQYVRLAANTDYWGGRPYLDELIIRRFQNEEAAVQALLADEAGAIESVPANLLPQLENNPNIKVVTTESFWFVEVILNSLKGSKANPLIFEPAIRQAMAHAVDKDFLVKTVLQGQGVPGLSVISPANKQWFNTGLKDYTFDLERAKSILEQAGYLDRDGDGIRETPDGKKLEFRFDISNDPSSFRAAQIISGWWKQIGISTNPQMSEDLSGLVYADDDKNGVVDHNFDLLIWSWSGEPDPDFNLMTMTTDQIGSWQDAGYSNPLYDQLYVDQGKAVDPALRRDMVWKMQEFLLGDLPYIVLWSPKRVQAYRADRWQDPVLAADGLLSRINPATGWTIHKVAPAPTAATDTSTGNSVPAAATGTAATGDGSGSGRITWIIAAVAAVIVVGILALRRRRSGDEE